MGTLCGVLDKELKRRSRHLSTFCLCERGGTTTPGTVRNTTGVDRGRTFLVRGYHGGVGSLGSCWLCDVLKVAVGAQGTRRGRGVGRETLYFTRGSEFNGRQRKQGRFRWDGYHTPKGRRGVFKTGCFGTWRDELYWGQAQHGQQLPPSRGTQKVRNKRSFTPCQKRPYGGRLRTK